MSQHQFSGIGFNLYIEADHLRGPSLEMVLVLRAGPLQWSSFSAKKMVLIFRAVRDKGFIPMRN
jgi:hypothetical protein